ncbi:MAG: fructosamine kinase family protein [Bacteroidetes bacterium]|nr:fructosamine kinase family protein [Bacteroidota bacterium]
MFPPISVIDSIRNELPDLLSGDAPAITPMQGNCHPAAKIRADKGSYFLKWNNLSKGNYFYKEAKGLKKIAASSSLATPEILMQNNTDDGYSFLLLRWIDTGYENEICWEKLGSGLASLHKKTSKFFGLDDDNFIGTLPQSNIKNTSWNEFFFNERLMKQIEISASAGKEVSFINKKLGSLYKKLGEIFPDEPAALLHGDLWSGNVIASSEEIPYIIDPAIYYGNREMEIAFTTLFGGFHWKFYQSYNEAYPLEKGFEAREDIYNLYPLLVHWNMFGGEFYNSIKSTLSRF